MQPNRFGRAWATRPPRQQKVEAVLAEAGAPATVESRKVRPEFTAFGQTEWSLTDQATFLSSAACDPGNQPIMDLMGQIAPDQQWGLGQIPGAKFKGGWGPSLEDNYLVRQFGVVPVNDGLAVVAVAVEPKSGFIRRRHTGFDADRDLASGAHRPAAGRQLLVQVDDSVAAAGAGDERVAGACDALHDEIRPVATGSIAEHAATVDGAGSQHLAAITAGVAEGRPVRAQNTFGEKARGIGRTPARMRTGIVAAGE